ncbi:MAG: T9SS type A sorting domain-containing protein [Bacteroidota bacterium]
MKKLNSIFYFLFCITGMLNAQLLTSNNALILVTAGGQLTVKGDILNNAGTTITNNGTIELTGNWTNNTGNTVFGTSQGTVIMNGANQLINGTDQTAFNTLTLLNGTKTLQQNALTGGINAVPSGVLNINNAVLDLNSKIVTVNNPFVAAITNSTGYIYSEQTGNLSKVTWNIGNVAGNHIIPFGNTLTAGVQIPFTFNLISGNTGNITVSTYKTAANNTPYPVTPIAVTHVYNTTGIDNSANMVDRFWEVDANGTGTGSLKFTWAAGENAANGNVNPRAQRWFSSTQGWELPLSGQSNPSVQSVNIPYNIVPFVTGNQSSFPWAVSLESSPLPIELISFTASSINNKQVSCKWSTASEINNDYFTVEKSQNGRTFDEAGRAEGAGNSTSVLDYSFIDEHPFNSISYYRLKQTDFNGSYSYSEIVAVTITKENNPGFSVFPNPVKDNLNIEFTSDNKQEVQLQLYDISGRKVISQSFMPVEGMNSGKADVSHISKGTYFIELTSGNVKSKLRIIKE